MTETLTQDEIAVGDVVSAQLEKMWGWYLAGGIIAMIFGFFVISYRHASVYAIVYLASGFFIAASPISEESLIDGRTISGCTPRSCVDFPLGR